MKSKSINEVILHVGLHKTGTTSIQETLSLGKNNRLLEKMGYIYPKDLPSNHSIPIFSAFCDQPEKYHINIKNGYSIHDIKNINENYLTSLEMEANNREPSKLIISGEDLSVLTFENLNTLKNYLKSTFGEQIEIRIIVYIRHPISWAVSDIQELVKGGRTYHQAFNQMENIISNLFSKRIKNFIDVFGQDNMQIVAFENSKSHKYGIVGHFLSLLGFSDNEIDQFSIISSNQSTSLVASNIISFINSKSPMIKDNKMHSNRKNGDFLPLLDIRGPKFDIPYSDKCKLYEMAYNDMQWINEISDINYTDELIKEGNINYKFTPEIVNDIKSIYNKLSEHLQNLLLEYLFRKADSSLLNESEKSTIIKLLNELDINKKKSSEINYKYNRFLNILGISEEIDPAVVYREIALLLEGEEQIKAASHLMNKALKHRPEGPFIKKKCEEYVREIEES